MKTSKKIAAALLLSNLFLSAPAAAQTGQASRPDGTHMLEMVLDDAVLRVSGGSPFDPCAIMFGVQETRFVLPGGALLNLMPLVLLPGEFDGKGRYAFDLTPYLEQPILPMTVFVQAISIVQDSEFFATSNPLVLGIAEGQARAQRSDDDDSDDGDADDRDSDTSDHDRDTSDHDRSTDGVIDADFEDRRADGDVTSDGDPDGWDGRPRAAR